MKRIKIFTLLVGLIGISGLSLAFPVFAVAPIPGNLIVNPDMQIESGATPANWHLGGFGDTSFGAYPVPGPIEGDKAAKITTTVHNEGDAKWMFDSVPAEAGALYTFSDYYNSDVTTFIIAAFTANGATEPSLFTTLASLPSSGGLWLSTEQTFTIPIGYSKVSVYHVISAVGNLSTTNYYLKLTATAADNLFSQGMVSLTFDDGWANQYDKALPILKNAGVKGTFFIISQAMLDADSVTSDNLLSVIKYPDVLTTSNSTSTTWSSIYTDPSNKTYRFTDFYTSTQPSFLEASYQLSGNSTTTILGSFPASPAEYNRASLAFTLTGNPLDTVTPISITHRVGSGTLTVASSTLTGYDTYMNSIQVLETQADGNEIGSHTVNHCNLVTGLCPDAVIPNSPDSLTPSQEISLSRDALLSAGITPVNALAYPYGAYNSSIKALLAGAGIAEGRTIDAGYNTKYSDKAALMIQTVDSATPLSRVYNWIDTAINNKLWLILTFHQIEDQATINNNNDSGAITPETFNSIVAYLNGKPTKTLSEGVALMSSIPPTTFTISSDHGPNGNITPLGTTVVSSGSSQTYSIIPAPNYNVADVLVDGQSVGAVSTYTFNNVIANHTISATFSAIPPTIYNIVATTGANGSISPAATTTVAQGGNQTYTITPNSGFMIDDVLVDNASVGSVSTYTFSNVAANHAIAATFKAIPITTYNIISSTGSNGTIAPLGTVTVNSGSNQVYTITANEGYKVSDVVVDGHSVGALNSYTFSNVVSSHTISVTFSILTSPVTTYTITASAGTNGSINPSGAITVNSGSDQTYNITPDSGFNISSVLIDGLPVNATNTYTFKNVMANHLIEASFSAIPPLTHTIIATAGVNGVISPAATTTVANGASQSYTITPNQGYHINDVSVDNISIGATSTYTFANVITDHSISATFKQRSAASGGGGGRNNYIEVSNRPLVISPNQSGKGTYNLDSDHRLIITIPNQGIEEKISLMVYPLILFSGNQLLEGLPDGTEIINNNAFMIRAVNEAGNLVENFSKDISISFDFPLPEDSSKIGLYHYDAENKRWIMIPGALIDTEANQVRFSVDHLSTFALIQSPDLAKVIYSYTPTSSTPAVKPKIYPNGSLFRTPDKKIYAIINGKKLRIKNLKELVKYKGVKISEGNFTDLDNYPNLILLDGTLVKGSDHKIYIIKDQKKLLIKNLNELKKYSGQMIIKVGDDVLNGF